MRLPSACLAVLLLAIVPAAAAPPDAALQQELLQIYDQWSRAVVAGDLKAAAATRSAEARGQIAGETKTKKAQGEFLQMMRLMTPDRVEVLHANLARDGAHASILTMASKTVPKGLKNPDAPPAGTVMQSEVTLNFVREGGAWRLNDLMFGVDPKHVKPCKDDRFDGLAAFDDSKDVEAGGSIVRVDFRPDVTLVVIRIVDEENCIFMPDKAKLTAMGMDVAKLVPYAVVEIGGWPHRSDGQKLWAQELRVRADE